MIFEQLKEITKFIIYRTPVLQSLMRPSYPYKVNPVQLSTLIHFIENTKGTQSVICEIGVAQGDTSVFILEHLKTTRDARALLLVDTFRGFTQSSKEYEVSERGKNFHKIDKFKYGNKKIFENNILNLGYKNVKIIESDCSLVNWEEVGPIAAVLLDVDLYQPTIRTLRNIWPHIISGGGIIVDDVAPGGDWDGAYQAYTEFAKENSIEIEICSEKGGILRK